MKSKAARTDAEKVVNMVRAAIKSCEPTLLERVQHQIGVLEQANAVADELVDEWAARAKGSGVPIGFVRQCEIDSRARGYSHLAALRALEKHLRN
jgi:hypothetical protein